MVHASWAMMILAVALLLPPLIFIFIAKRGRQLYIRRIPGIDAIEEALGRATELGRPIVFTTGMTQLDSLLYAILGIISHVGRKCASFGCRLIVPQRDYEVMPVVSETVREAYRTAGRIDAFNPQDIRYLSPEQFAFASGYMGIVHREKAASCFMFGDFAAESLVLAEAGQQVGAMQVAGTVSYNQVPFFLTSCDYTIIGEEVYAAGAYLSREPAQLGSVRGQDVAKLIVLALVLTGTAAATWASVSRRDPREGTKYNSGFAKLLYKMPEQKVVLPNFEVKNGFEPAKTPTQDDLDSGAGSARPAGWTPRGEENDLERMRARISHKADRARGVLKLVAGLSKDLAAELRPRLGLFAGTQDEAKAAELARLLDAVADRSGQEAADIETRLRTRLPEVEKSIAARARERAAELARPELKLLAEWAEDAGKAAGDDCIRLIAEARDSAAGSDGVPEMTRRLLAARGACHRSWSALAGAHMQAAGKAARGRPPVFLGDLSGDGVPLELDASRAFSGRLLPLACTWTVIPAPGADGKTEFEGPQASVAVARAGTYSVKLRVSEKPDRPKPMVLALLTNDPTDVRHETIAAGTEVRLSWRAPRNIVAGSSEFSWDLGDGSREATGSGKEFAVTHKYEKAGICRMELEVRYRRRVGDEAAGPASKAPPAAEGDPRLVRLRQSLAVGLTDVCDRLSETDELLADAKSEAEGYGGRLSAVEGLTETAWPDKALAGEMSGALEKLRTWAAEQNRELGRRLSAVQSLGAARSPAAGEAPAAGTATSAAPEARTPAARDEPCWNRFRVYFRVVDPKDDSATQLIEVRRADPVLPRAPWEPRPKPPEPPKPAEAGPVKEVGK